jgi:membrane protease YdiL (CAAX protease family)
MDQTESGLTSGPLPALRTPAPGLRRVTAIAEVLLCSGIPTQLAITAALTLFGFAPSTDDSAFVVTLLLADTVAVILVMVVLLRTHGESPRELWLGSRPPGRETARGIALIPLIFLIVVVLLNTLRLIAPGLHNVPVNPVETMAGRDSMSAALFGLAGIVAGGVREELQRAFLLRRFEQHLGGTGVGVVVLSAGFGLAHFLQGWDAVITTGVLGALWAVIYVRRRSSLAPIVSHAGFNSLEVLRVAALGS